MAQWNLDTLCQLDPRKAPDWPLLAQLIGAGSCASIILLTGYLLILEPRIARLDASRQHALELKQTLHTKQLSVGTLHQQEQQLEVLRAKTQARLRSTTTPFLTLMHQIAVVRRLRVERLQPVSHRVRNGLNESILRLTLSGIYHDLLGFTRDLTTLPYLSSLENLQLSYNKEHRLTLNARLSVVDLPRTSTTPASPSLEGARLSAPASKLKGLPNCSDLSQVHPNPFLRHQPRHRAMPCFDSLGPFSTKAQQYEFGSLELIGVVAQGKKRWGLLRTPDGKVHTVKPGDTLGLPYGRIIALRPHTITIEVFFDAQHSIPHVIQLWLAAPTSP